jgi:hypothetical protein
VQPHNVSIDLRKTPNFTGRKCALVVEHAGNTRLLTIVIGHERTFVGDPVDIGRGAAHHAAIVGAYIPQPILSAMITTMLGFLAGTCASASIEPNSTSVTTPVASASNFFVFIDILVVARREFETGLPTPDLGISASHAGR